MRKKNNILKSLHFIYLILILPSVSCNKEEDFNLSDFYAESEKFTNDNNGDLSENQIKIDTLYFKDATTSSFYKVYVIDSYSDLQQHQTRDVLYLLHGYGCQADCWLSMGLVEYMTAMNNKYDKTPVIIMPEAFDSYYVDGFKREHNYESFFIKDLLPQLEDRYDCGKNIGKRCIGGFSMGAYGSLYYSVKYDEMFDFTYALSGSFEGRDLEKTPPILKLLEGKKTGHFPYLIIDIGESDPFLPCNIDLHLLLDKLNIEHEFLIKEGNHDWNYWTENLYSVVRRIFEFTNNIEK